MMAKTKFETFTEKILIVTGGLFVLNITWLLYCNLRQECHLIEGIALLWTGLFVAIGIILFVVSKIITKIKKYIEE